MLSLPATLRPPPLLSAAPLSDVLLRGPAALKKCAVLAEINN
jgi:hypothetical protein